MNRITIKDLSKMLSLAPSTISRALQDHPDISDDTKSRVKQAAVKFNYVPNLHARFFRKKHSGLVALVIPQFNMFFTPNLMEGIKSLIDDKDYSLIVFQSNNSTERETQIVNYCLSWVVDGVLMVLADSTTDLSHIADLRQSDIPIVLLDKVLETDQISTVTIDDVQASYQATNHLISHGKKNIVGVFANPVQTITQNRIVGFQKALKDNGMTIKPPQIFTNENIADFKNEFNALLEANSFDAAFIMSDELLVNTYSVLRSRKIEIPNEFALMALSDGQAPYHIFPYASHIHHSGYEIGRVACQQLINYIEAKKYSVNHLKLETSLVELQSI